PQSSVGVDGVEITVFAIGIYYTVCVYHRCVDTPLKTNVGPLITGVIRNAGHRSIGVAHTSLSICVLKLPLDLQVRVESCDEERAILARRAKTVIVAIGTEAGAATIFVVLDDD